MKKLFTKYSEIITYIVFGVLTTVVSWGTYILCERLLHTEVAVSNTISITCAIAFAYITNKLWVFKSKSWELKVIGRELATFISSRIVTGVIELVSVPLLERTGFDNIVFNFLKELKLDSIKILFTDGIYSKILISIIIVILNYVFSKLIVFRKNNK